MAIVVLALACAPPGHAAPPPSTGSSGYWLLDTAWNQAATLSKAPTQTDATELVCLLQAATRLDPKLPEAWRQQYDLLSGLGRQAEAVQAIAKYLELAPDDEPVYLAYVAEQVSAAQTAEQRLAACDTWLGRKGIPAAVASYLHHTMAEILANRLQNDQAVSHAREAVRLFPYDLAARRLLLDLTDRRGPAAEMEIALWSVRRNPSDSGAMVQVAALADALGLHEQAATWYTQAQETLANQGQGTAPVGLRMAEHYLDAGQPDLAIGRLGPLSRQPRPAADSWLLLSEAHEMQGDTEQARQIAMRALRMVAPEEASQPAGAAAATQPTAAATQPATLPTIAPSATGTVPATQPADLAARVPAIWIRVMYLGEAAAVLDDARTLWAAYPDQAWARRTYGWALLKAGQADKAVQIFTPAAPLDAWSALGLAEAQFEGGDKQASADNLRLVHRLAPSGAVWRAAKRWTEQVGLTLPGPEASQVREAKALLTELDKTLLRLPMHPGEFLQLKVTMDVPPPAGEPWFGRIELTNISNQPIYCGSDGVLMPNVLLSAMVYDPASRDIGQRLLLSLYRQFVLQPGQTVRLGRPLDNGPLREVLRNPYRRVKVIFTAILDPIRTVSGSWQAGPAGVIAEPVAVNREILQPAKDLDFATRVRNGPAAEKIYLARRIACVLIGLQDRAAQTQPIAPPAATLEQAMAVLLQDPDPMVAAHALAQANHVTLTDTLAKAAATQVGGDNWLSRLLAIRLFAHKQGNKFTRALGGLSSSDPDTLVRQLAAAYHAAFQKSAGNRG
jgi:tetratricopeptide (TPR) repeat protein